MTKTVPFSTQELFAFIDRAGKATWASGGAKESQPQRPDYNELVYVEGELEYRDSYTGAFRSWGTEVVRYQGVPIWNCLYGGGMIEGKEHLADETYAVLKKALRTDEDTFQSMRGPAALQEGDWLYSYTQEGDVSEFHGYEEIRYKGDLVFFHRTIGGKIG